LVLADVAFVRIPRIPSQGGKFAYIVVCGKAGGDRDDGEDRG